jgi:FkbM family methyltransferase
LRSHLRPELFIDVGGNYGTHSLLFLASAVETITVEPNPECREYFMRLCGANGLVPKIEPYAAGASAGEVSLAFPEGETWLGSVNAAVSDSFLPSSKVVTLRVPQRPLDDLKDRVRGRRTLIKIDAEGSELAILLGADSILRDFSPMVIFESWQDETRAAIFDELYSRGYEIRALPFDPALEGSAPPPSQVAMTAATNFIAYHPRTHATALARS